MLTGAEPQQGVVIYCFGSDFFSRMSNPVVETRTSNCAGLVTGTKVPEPYSASSNGSRKA